MGQKTLSSGNLANMRYIRDMAFEQDMYIKRRMHMGVPADKTDTKYLIKQSINQLACMNAKIERAEI